MKFDLPKPVCKLGYDTGQLNTILGPRLAEFEKWMCGQTMAVCDGRIYNPNTKKYHPSGCGPHGTIVYPHDLERFLLGLPVID